MEMGYRVIWTDEACYTRSTVCRYTCKRAKSTIMFGRKDPSLKCIVMVVGVSLENGIDSYRIELNSINQYSYMDYLK